MRKLMFITAICAVLAAPALAGPTVIVYQTGYSSGSGGEFTAKPIGWSWNPLPYYDTSTSNIGPWDPSFQTFCVESSEYFYPGTEYSVTFGDNAIKGGVGPLGDPISKGTAYLYHMFQNQDPKLTPYDWSEAGRSASAGALQNAIWALEGEGGGINAAYTNLLTARFGSVAAAQADNAGLYPVKVMSLWDKGYPGDLSHVAQDMLVCVPVPGAVLLGMLGLSAAGLKLRKFA